MQSLRIKYFGIKAPAWSWRKIVAAIKNINAYHLGCFFICYLALQAAYFFGLSLQQEFRVERDILAVENRISLDLPRLSLPNRVLNLAGNPAQISDYLDRLNRLLVQQHTSVRVISLQQFNAGDMSERGLMLASEQDHAHMRMERKLYLPGESINLVIGVCQLTLWQNLSILPLITSVVLSMLFFPYLRTKKHPQKISSGTAIPGSSTKRDTETQRVEKIPAESNHTEFTLKQTNSANAELILDLENKCLRFGTTNVSTFLANKPLCFYAALLTYCQRYPGARLCQHAPLPEELLALANQYFLRLVALGHTIRKRPDFDMNLEKMLSEIRAALDELLLDHPHHKTFFYPPKALGEGSRSKVHNFALLHIAEAHWTIKGK